MDGRHQLLVVSMSQAQTFWYLHVKIDVLTDQDSQRGVRLSS